MKKNILIINAALNGRLGSTEKLLQIAAKKLSENFDVDFIYLNEHNTYNKYLEKILNAAGFIIGTGVHWSSWSSLFQKFIEGATDGEGSKLWLGKPCGFVVTSHSFGGAEVLSKLITTMNLFGCYTPPCCGVSYSMAEHDALKLEKNKEKSEYWRLEHIDTVLCHNFAESLNGSKNWKFWNDYPEHSLEKAWLE